MTHKDYVEARKRAEEEIREAIIKYHQQTGLVPRACLLWGHEVDDSGEIVGIGDLKVSLRVEI